MSDPPKDDKKPEPKLKQMVMKVGLLSIKGPSAVLITNPRNVYDHFLNAYFQACDLTFTREQCQARGNEAWKVHGKDKELVKKFIDAKPLDRMKILKAPEVKPHRSVGLTVAEESRFAAARIEELKHADQTKVPFVAVAGLTTNINGLVKLLGRCGYCVEMWFAEKS